MLYNGGTVFTADKKIGSLTIFNSMILHEVTPVTTGIRKSLVGWAIGPEWR